MPWIGPALGVGGSLLSGAFGGAKDPGPSGASQTSAKRALNQSDRYNDAYWGSNWRGSLQGDSGINQQVDGGDGTQRSQFRYGSGGTGGNLAAAASLYGGTTPYGTMPIHQQLVNASGQGINENNQTLADYNQGAEQGYREAQKYGTGQNAVIESDASKSLAGANAATLARMQAMGLGGSTLTTDAMGANAAGNFRELSRAKANVADQATGMKLQQRNTATAGRAALSQGINSSNQNLRMMPIQGDLNAIGNQVVNPFSAQGGSAPATAQNGILNSLGGTASQLGGLYLAKSLYGGSGSGAGGTGQQTYGNPGGPLGW